MKVRVPTVLVAAILASLVAASVARAVPKVTVPSDIVAEAAGPTGANVTYQASAQEDTTSTDLPISCTNPDGTTNVSTYRCQVCSVLCIPILVANGNVCTRESR